MSLDDEFISIVSGLEEKGFKRALIAQLSGLSYTRISNIIGGRTKAKQIDVDSVNEISIEDMETMKTQLRILEQRIRILERRINESKD